MARDPNKLRVFQVADALVPDVYKVTSLLPDTERYGLQSQIRRASVSAATNIVEGCARRTTKDYVHFLFISLSSASETAYLLSLCSRLGMVPSADIEPLLGRHEGLKRGLQKLIDSLS